MTSLARKKAGRSHIALFVGEAVVESIALGVELPLVALGKFDGLKVGGVVEGRAVGNVPAGGSKDEYGGDGGGTSIQYPARRKPGDGLVREA